MRRTLTAKATLILLITFALSAPAYAQQRGARRKSYSGPVKIRVREGDTIPGLAERFNVPAAEIARLNDLAANAELKSGEEIFIPAASSDVVQRRRSAAGITNEVRARAFRYEPLIAEASARYGVDPRLLWTIAFLESRFRPGAVSYKNGQPCAHGLMQFTLETAAHYGLLQPLDPRASIDAASRYVRDLIARFGGRADLVLASYNAGEGAVEAYLKGISIRLPNGRIINPNRLQTGGIPPYTETQNYVSQGLGVAQEITQANIFSQANQEVGRAPLTPLSGNKSNDSIAGVTASSATEVARPEPAPRTPVSSYAFGVQPMVMTSETKTQASSELNWLAPRPTITRSFRATRALAEGDSSRRVVERQSGSSSSTSAPTVVTTTQTRSTYAGVAEQR